MYAAMNSTALPKLDVLKAIVTGCGGSNDDLRAFTTAWRRIASGESPVRRPAASTLPPHNQHAA